MSDTASKGPVPGPGILGIEPYKGGASKAPGAARVHKLSSNESPLGPSPKAVEAYRACADELFLYPDGGMGELRSALAALHGLDAERVVCGNGSDDLLALLALAYLQPGDEVLITENAFLFYEIAAKAQGATVKVAANRNLTTDVDALLGAVGPKTKIVFLANPNNPTGTYVPASEVVHLHRGLPENVLLVLDEAYAEYVEAEGYASGLALVDGAANIVVTRTFSKIYGLAALRLGWAYAPPAIADVLNRIRGPFNVNRAAQAAGLAALADQDHIARARAHNSKWRPRLATEIAKLGLEVTPGVANFVLFHLPGRAGQTAADADAYLKAKGFILRRMESYGLPQALRLTVGDEEANQGVIAALADFLAEGVTLGTAHG